MVIIGLRVFLLGKVSLKTLSSRLSTLSNSHSRKLTRTIMLAAMYSRVVRLVILSLGVKLTHKQTGTREVRTGSGYISGNKGGM